jgi:hypothetical protein
MMNQVRPFKIPNAAISSLSHLKDVSCQKKVQWLDLASRLGLILIGLPLARTINVHYEIIIKSSKPSLTSSPNYFWFMQYMKNDNGDIDIIQFPSSMIFSYT